MLFHPTKAPFWYSVTEEPYKIPHYAAVVRALDEYPGSDTDTLLGKQVLDDFYKGFQGFLDKLAWREVRLCVSCLCTVLAKYF